MFIGQQEQKENTLGIIILTKEKDRSGNPIMVSMLINSEGNYQDVKIEVNILTSAHGREGNIDNFLGAVKEDNRLLSLDNKKSQQNSNGTPEVSFLNNSYYLTDFTENLAQFREKVKGIREEKENHILSLDNKKSQQNSNGSPGVSFPDSTYYLTDFTENLAQFREKVKGIREEKENRILSLDNKKSQQNSNGTPKVQYLSNSYYLTDFTENLAQFREKVKRIREGKEAEEKDWKKNGRNRRKNGTK